MDAGAAPLLVAFAAPLFAPPRLQAESPATASTSIAAVVNARIVTPSFESIMQDVTALTQSATRSVKADY
jgi:hypothetical protein